MTILVDQIRVEKEADRLETRDKSKMMKGNRNKFKLRLLNPKGQFFVQNG